MDFRKQYPSISVSFSREPMKQAIMLVLTATTVAVCQEPTPITAQRHVERLPFAPASLLLKEPPPLEPIAPLPVLHGRRDRKVIALTFDACSTRKPSHYDKRITRILVETKTPATLFLGGKWMEEEAEQTKYLASIPYFELGNHTFLHPHLVEMSDDGIRRELSWTQEVMYSLTGRQPTLFRPPVRVKRTNAWSVLQLRWAFGPFNLTSLRGTRIPASQRRG